MIKREEREREGDRLDVSFCEIWSKLKTNFKLASNLPQPACCVIYHLLKTNIKHKMATQNYIVPFCGTHKLFKHARSLSFSFSLVLSCSLKESERRAIQDLNENISIRQIPYPIRF